MDYLDIEGMKEDIKQEKAEDFAIRIINLFKELKNKRDEHVMSKQILRSGTSIGANIAESYNAESDSDYIHKLAIAQKEASETAYWLRILKRSSYITEAEFQSMNADVTELRRIITNIIIKRKAKL